MVPIGVLHLFWWSHLPVAVQPFHWPLGLGGMSLNPGTPTLSSSKLAKGNAWKSPSPWRWGASMGNSSKEIPSPGWTEHDMAATQNQAAFETLQLSSDLPSVLFTAVQLILSDHSQHNTNSAAIMPGRSVASRRSFLIAGSFISNALALSSPFNTSRRMTASDSVGGLEPMKKIKPTGTPNSSMNGFLQTTHNIQQKGGCWMIIIISLTLLSCAPCSNQTHEEADW